MGVSIHLDSTVAGALPASADAAWRSVAGLEVEELFAKSRTTETAAVRLLGAGRIVRKRWTWPRRRDRIKGALAPQPLAHFERRRGGVLTECMLLLREIEGATDLAKWLASSRPGRMRS